MVSFRLKFEAILQALEGSSSQLSESFLFIRALKSLNANQTQRSPLMAFLECRNMKRTWSNLKKATIELFGVYSEASAKGPNISQMGPKEEARLLIWGTRSVSVK